MIPRIARELYLFLGAAGAGVGALMVGGVGLMAIVGGCLLVAVAALDGIEAALRGRP